MTKQKLEKYRKKLIVFENKERKLEEIASKEPDTIVGTVQKTSKGFPYLPGRISVYMYDPRQEETINRRVENLKKDAKDILAELKEVEAYIQQIEDAELKEIFAMRYIEGKTQQEVADMLGWERSTVAKKISSYIISHNSQNECANMIV